MAWSPTRERLHAYCAEMRTEGYDATAATDPEAVCAAADIIITTTPARETIVKADWLRDGVHVTAVGSDSPGKRELDPECLDRADLVVVDRYGQCAAFGELKHALDAALLTRHDVHGELGEIVAGRKPGRTTDMQITIADLTGVGFQDTAIASACAGLISER
jgi:ornithine cyclodeaminase